MKKILSFFLCFAMLAIGSAAVSAADKVGSAPATNPLTEGYSGPELFVITPVKDTVAMSDDTPVILRGNIVKSQGMGLYLFRDDSGIIQIQISDEIMPNQPITPNDIVEIHGEVEKGLGSMHVEADLVIVKPRKQP